MNYELKMNRLLVKDNKMTIAFSGSADVASEVAHPKVILHFFDTVTGEDRRLPLVLKQSYVNKGRCYFSGEYVYNLAYIFYKKKDSLNTVEMYINVLFEDYYEEKVKIDLTPEEHETEAPLYDVKVCGDHLEIKRYPVKIAKNLKEAGFFTKLYTWIVFFIGLFLLPLFFIDALLAELKVVQYRSEYVASGASSAQRIVRHMNNAIRSFSRHEINFIGIKVVVLRILYNFRKIGGLGKNTIGLISVRRNELSGNMAFVYDQLKDREGIKIETFFCDKEFKDMKFKDLCGIARVCAKSKVIAVDEYTFFIYQLQLRPEVKVIQLWHACGAFKTFGYTRLGQQGGTMQTSPTHRNYDFATVSSENIVKWYAEAFGVPTNHVVATGIPRTDVFFDQDYKAKTIERLYNEYPSLKGKKVIMYAPTFRGPTRIKAYYPMDKFDIGHFLDNISDEYMLIIKHHPFVTKKHPVPKKYKDRVLDLSESSELNDLLFVTDLIITDYSSLVFEASLLNIPMLFYTFDLKEYIRERDFYFNFETFVPGRFFFEQSQMEEAIRTENYQQEKVDAFAHKFFDKLDGQASKRVADLMCHALNK